jgi:hypothetical protein
LEIIAINFSATHVAFRFSIWILSYLFFHFFLKIENSIYLFREGMEKIICNESLFEVDPQLLSKAPFFDAYFTRWKKDETLELKDYDSYEFALFIKFLKNELLIDVLFFETLDFFGLALPRPMKTLRMAAFEGDIQAINLHLIYAPNSNMTYGLCGAVHGNHWDLIKFFCAKGGKLSHVPLFDAAGSNNMEMVEFLIGNGAHNWNSGLSGAALVGNQQMIDFFINKGANNFNNALENAVRGGHKETIEFFMYKATDIRNGFYGAILNEDARDFWMSEFLTRGITFNCEKALQQAAFIGDIRLMKRFIEAGGNNFNRALLRAVFAEQKIEVVKFLIQRGANNFSEALAEAKEEDVWWLVDFFENQPHITVPSSVWHHITVPSSVWDTPETAGSAWDM